MAEAQARVAALDEREGLIHAREEAFASMRREIKRKLAAVPVEAVVADDFSFKLLISFGCSGVAD
jgi:hypothetical protein